MADQTPTGTRPVRYRRNVLLAAIRAHQGPVTTAVAERLLAGTWPTYGRNTARRDLRGLARHGHLAAVDIDGRRAYRPTASEDGVE